MNEIDETANRVGKSTDMQQSCPSPQAFDGADTRELVNVDPHGGVSRWSRQPDGILCGALSRMVTPHGPAFLRTMAVCGKYMGVCDFF